jgi:hypothetical protein
MARQRQRHTDIDLDETTEYQVRIMRAADDDHPAGILLYEGPTRFRLTALPRVRSILGPRYEVTPLAYDRDQGWQFPTDYLAGAEMIVGPDDILCIFLDVRHEALSTYSEVKGLRRCYVAP